MSLLLLSLEALGRAEPLSDKICFPDDCRNTLSVWGEQSQEMKQLRDELVRLAAEIGTMMEVILGFGKGAWVQ